MNEENNNIIDFKKARTEKQIKDNQKKSNKIIEKSKQLTDFFVEAVQKNIENKKREEEERRKHNEKVKRSYRLTNKPKK